VTAVAEVGGVAVADATGVGAGVGSAAVGEAVGAADIAGSGCAGGFASLHAASVSAAAERIATVRRLLAPAVASAPQNTQRGSADFT
jgi:hypothetical protein